MQILKKLFWNMTSLWRHETPYDTHHRVVRSIVPSLMLVPQAVSEELKQTDTQNCTLYVRFLYFWPTGFKMSAMWSSVEKTLETSVLGYFFDKSSYFYQCFKVNLDILAQTKVATLDHCSKPKTPGHIKFNLWFRTTFMTKSNRFVHFNQSI